MLATAIGMSLNFIGHVGGSLIHLLLVIALIVFIINLVMGRRRGL